MRYRLFLGAYIFTLSPILAARGDEAPQQPPTPAAQSAPAPAESAPANQPATPAAPAAEAVVAAADPAASSANITVERGDFVLQTNNTKIAAEAAPAQAGSVSQKSEAIAHTAAQPLKKAAKVIGKTGKLTVKRAAKAVRNTAKTSKRIVTNTAKRSANMVRRASTRPCDCGPTRIVYSRCCEPCAPRCYLPLRYQIRYFLCGCN